MWHSSKYANYPNLKITQGWENMIILSGSKYPSGAKFANTLTLYTTVNIYIKTSYRRWSDALCLQGTTKLVKKNNHRYTLERDEDYPNGAAFLPEKVNMKKKSVTKHFNKTKSCNVKHWSRRFFKKYTSSKRLALDHNP